MTESDKRTKAAGVASGLDLTDAEMAKINNYTLRELLLNEVYAFRVTLCDNEVDRDFERFTIPALHKMAELFLGKTGVFDHNPKAANQTSRIFDTEVVEDRTRKTKTGEPYTKLTAKAYMLRDDGTAGTIRNIDAGILKEVSVGCAVGRIICSVCGAEQREKPCKHIKGTLVSGNLCHHLLDEPTDAYEWSFVAVPAQPGAGVTKHISQEKPESISPEVEELIKSANILANEILKGDLYS